ncbi:hypothetical protein CI109_105830 [Kwoniella shandongensis]|uniref:Uncharacterized protein n=1 Tax=Kwoniella shandongensis TaxID=1734106 RepID=A0AAJ8LMM1_9TREE
MDVSSLWLCIITDPSTDAFGIRDWPERPTDSGIDKPLRALLTDEDVVAKSHRCITYVHTPSIHFHHLLPVHLHFVHS